MVGLLFVGSCTWVLGEGPGKTQNENGPDVLPVPKELTPPVVAATKSPTPWPADALDGVHGWLAIHSGTPENSPP